jgi:hypothetical protein
VDIARVFDSYRRSYWRFYSIECIPVQAEPVELKYGQMEGKIESGNLFPGFKKLQV